VEAKNLNSLRGVGACILAEAARQAAVLDGGGAVAPETRAWDALRGASTLLRGKGDAADYRFLPEADVEPLLLPAAQLARLLRELPPRLAATIAYLRHARPPPPAVVVALGALCVLLGVSTTWRSAVAIVSSPDALVAALLQLCGGGGGGGGEEEEEDDGVEEGEPQSPLALDGAAAELRAAAASAAVAAAAAAHEPACPAPPAAVLTLARRLLNKRPDLRAEARCLRLSVAPADGSPPLHEGPFVAFLVVVEVVMALALHHTAAQQRLRRLG
jgi:hypothetical protein